jgi:protein phosphatase 1 regulatory subunit 7
MTGIRRERKVTMLLSRNDITVLSTAAASFSLERHPGKSVAIVENWNPSRWRLENRIIPVDDQFYLRDGIARNIAINDIIRDGETSSNFRLAIKCIESSNPDTMPDLSFLDRLEEQHDRTRARCKIISCYEKLDRESLDFSENDLSRVPGCICDFNNIKKLYLYGNNITKINGLDCLKGLKELSLKNNKIKKLEGLDNLKKLKILYSKNNPINKIEGLDKLKNLEVLDLEENRITKIDGIEKLLNLKKLNLINNTIKKIEGLDNLKNLVSVELDGNRIEKIEGFGMLDKLTRLGIGGNKIRKIEGIDALVNLEGLRAWDNEIEKIEGLDNLKKLRSLGLSNNEISKVEGLDSLEKLKWLDLSNNQVPINDCKKLKKKMSDTLVLC